VISQQNNKNPLIPMESQYMPLMTFPPVYCDRDNHPFLFSISTPYLFKHQQQQIPTCYPTHFNVPFGSSIYQNYSSPSFAIPPAPTSMCFQQFPQISYPSLVHFHLNNQCNNQRNDQLKQTYYHQGEQLVPASHHRSPTKKPLKNKKRPLAKQFTVGRWSSDEHDTFLKAMAKYGERNWNLISLQVRTRSREQCQSHGQKWFLKRQKLSGN
jgi:SHAQKYF class myb-like DNA-binding protein